MNFIQMQTEEKDYTPGKISDLLRSNDNRILVNEVNI